MTTEQYIVAAVVPLIVLWPRITAWAKSFLAARPAAGPTGPTFEQAVHDLAGVRLRLTQTSLLADEQKKAIDTLTLALVAGSDK